MYGVWGSVGEARDCVCVTGGGGAWNGPVNHRRDHEEGCVYGAVCTWYGCVCVCAGCVCMAGEVQGVK